MQLIEIKSSTIGTDVKDTVNARNLHAFLEVKKDFSSWIKEQIERARLVENRDFIKLTEKGELSKTGQTRIEYHLTIEAGKNISMMSQTDKGFEVRDYFLECEKVAQNPMALLNDPAILKTLLLANIEQVAQLESRVSERDKLIAVTAPKAEALDKISIADGEMCLSNAGKVLGWHKLKDFFQWLHSIKWTFRRGGEWVAHQEQLRSAFMVAKVVKYNNSDGTEQVKEQALIC